MVPVQKTVISCQLHLLSYSKSAHHHPESTCVIGQSVWTYSERRTRRKFDGFASFLLLQVGEKMQDQQYDRLSVSGLSLSSGGCVRSVDPARRTRSDSVWTTCRRRLLLPTWLFRRAQIRS